MTIAEQIRQLGGAQASFSNRDRGLISAFVVDADDITIGRIYLTKRAVNSEERKGLLTRVAFHDSARDPRYITEVVTITPVGAKPPRRYHYLNHFDPSLETCSPSERRGLKVAEQLKLRLAYGVGGGRNKLHEDDWPTLKAALEEVA